MAEITEVFPQIKDIKDKTLREKVIKCWNEALSRGGWQTDDLERIPFTLLITDADISLASHTRNVTDCALALGRVMSKAYAGKFKIDFDLLLAGAILHDVAKAIEYKEEDGKISVSRSGRLLRHPIAGCALAAEIGLPEEVQHMIAVHSREGDSSHRMPEAYIIHHADFVNFEPLKDPE